MHFMLYLCRNDSISIVPVDMYADNVPTRRQAIQFLMTNYPSEYHATYFKTHYLAPTLENLSLERNCQKIEFAKEIS